MHIVDISIIIAFLIATLYIGFNSSKKIKTFSDYAIGNRKFSDFAICCTVAASIIGGSTTMGGVGKTYEVGITQFLAQVGRPIAYFIVGAFLARRLSNYYGCFSMGDMFYKSYGMSGKIFSGCIGFFYLILGVGLQFMAMGTAISVLTNLPYMFCLFISAGIVLIYTGRGGIRAVTFTDVLQFAVLIVAIPILLVVVLVKIGGTNALIESLPQSHMAVSGKNFNRYLFLMIPLMLPTLSPVHIQHLLMTRNREQGVKAYYNVCWIYLFVVIMTIGLGLAAKVLFPHLTKPDQALFTLIINYFPVGIFGMAVIGILAVLMSTADSDLNSGSIMLVNDIIIPCNRYIKSKELSEEEKLKWAHNTSVIIGVGAIIFASQCSGLFETRILMRTLWMSVILSPLYFLIFNMKIPLKGLCVSAIIGLTTCILWNINMKPITKIDGLFPGFFANVITVLFFYFLGGRQKVFSREELGEMRRVEALQIKKWPSIRDLQEQNNTVLGLCLVFLQLMPLVFEAGSLSYSKLMLTLVNGTLAILLIFGNSLEIFSEEKRFQWLKLTTLFFCLPVTSAYLVMTSAENGLHVLTLLLSFVIMFLSVEKEQERKIIWVCGLTGFVTLVAYLNMGCEIYWPQVFSMHHLIYLLSFGVVLLLLKSNMNTISVSIQQKQYATAYTLLQNLMSRLGKFKALLENNSNEEDSKKQKIMLNAIRQVYEYLNDFVSNIAEKCQHSKLKNLNKVTIGCSLPIASAYLFFSIPRKQFCTF